MSIENLYVHIGAGKTGTTAIQELLYANSKALAECDCFHGGIIFEAVKPSRRATAAAVMEYYEEFKSATKDERFAAVHKGLRSTAECCRRKGLKTAIWSWESLFLLPGAPEAIRAAAGETPVKIVVYVRRQDHWLASAYQQWGVPYTAFDFDSWMPRFAGACDYHARLAPWAEAFGRDNIIVRVYEKEQMPDGIFEDFLGAIGLALSSSFCLPKRQSNPSFDRHVEEMIHSYRSIGDTASKQCQDLTSMLYRSLSQREMKPMLVSRSALPLQTRLEILEQYAESNRKVAMEYLGRDDGRLFQEKDPSGENAPDESPLSLESAVRVLLQVLVNQETRLMKLECK